MTLARNNPVYGHSILTTWSRSRMKLNQKHLPLPTYLPIQDQCRCACVKFPSHPALQVRAKCCYSCLALYLQLKLTDSFINPPTSQFGSLGSLPWTSTPFGNRIHWLRLDQASVTPGRMQRNWKEHHHRSILATTMFLPKNTTMVFRLI